MSAKHEKPRGISNRRELQIFLQADLQAHGLKKWNWTLAYRRPELRYQRLMRYVEYWNTKHGRGAQMISLWLKFRLLRQAAVTGISFPAGVALEGLSIAHFGSIVVNSKAKIGRYCRIHSATNIGTAGGGVPRIGDFVYIGPGAVLYGDIVVGDGAIIGANSVVNKSVPSGVTVAGVPARVISERDSSSIMPAWFPNSRDQSQKESA